MTKRLILGSILSLTTLCGLAAAQATKPTDGPLKGPAVKETGVPGENRKFSGGTADRKDRMAREIPHRMFMRAFDVVRGDKAESGTRLSDDQSAKIEAIDTEFKSSVRKYADEHKDEISKLPPEARRRIEAATGAGLGGDLPRGRGKDMAKGEGKGPPGEKAAKTPHPAGEGGDQPSGRPAPNSKEAAAFKAQVKALLEGAPKANDFHAKMWTVLSDAQKPIVQKELDRLKADAPGKRDGVGKGKGAGKNADDGDDMKEMDSSTFDVSKLPPKLQERLKDMSPEQKEEFIKKFKERRSNK